MSTTSLTPSFPYKVGTLVTMISGEHSIKINQAAINRWRGYGLVHPDLVQNETANGTNKYLYRRIAVDWIRIVAQLREKWGVAVTEIRTGEVLRPLINCTPHDSEKALIVLTEIAAAAGDLADFERRVKDWAKNCGEEPK
jgi:hypothetical protein